MRKIYALVFVGLAGFGAVPGVAQTCPTPPALPEVVKIDRAEASDTAAAPPDAQIHSYQASIRPYRAYVGFAVRSVDAALGVPAPSGQVASRACLDRMFKDNMAHHTMIARDHAMQSGYEQQWALAGMSLAAFKLEQAGQPLSPQALEWLRALARAVMDFHDHHSLQNNHLLWAALGVGTTGYLAGDQELIDWANESTRQSLSTMNPDGTLALELLRGPKASAYHYFAAQPVFVYSAVRRCFHDPPRAPWPDQLERLSAVLDRIEDDPQFLAQRAGVPQRAITPEQSQWRALFAPAGDRAPLPRIDASVGRRGGQLSTTARALDCH